MLECFEYQEDIIEFKDKEETKRIKVVENKSTVEIIYIVSNLLRK